MTLVKTSILSFIATAIQMLAALVINKAVAVYIGPMGLALVGQFQNFIQFVMTLAQGGINNGVTKYAAEYGKDQSRMSGLLSTALRISLVSSFFVGLMIVLFSNFASLHFLKTEDYGYIFVLFGFTIVLFVINNLLLSILNGLKEIKLWVIINIAQSIYSLIFTSLLIVFLGLQGALLGLVTNQSVILLIVLFMLRDHKKIKMSNFLRCFNKHEAVKLGGFALMAITSAATIPVSHMIIREYLGDNVSWTAAGYWQAIWYISTLYLMVITTTLSIYYLPKLSETTDRSEIRKEIIRGYKIIIPIAILMALIIFTLKDFIVWFLFTEDFAPMLELFLWQLIGDVIKISSFMFAFIMLAKAMTKTYILTEILFSFIFVVCGIYMIDKFGLIGITYAFTLTYTIYLVVVFYLTRHFFKKMD